MSKRSQRAQRIARLPIDWGGERRLDSIKEWLLPMIENERPPNKDGLVNHIRQCRFQQNEMTQQELATRVSVTRQTIVALESGRYSPSLPLAIRICRVFGKSVEDVFELHVDTEKEETVRK